MLLAINCTTTAQIIPEKGREVQDWTILQSWDIPANASGLAWDGTYIYFGIYGADGDHFYQFNPSNGQAQLLFTNPTIGDCFGMTWDGSSLWITDHVTSPSIPASAIELDLSGNILSTFDLPDHYMSGIAADGSDFWVCTYYPDPGTVYKLNSSGAILSQFTSPNDQPWDICTHGSDLWIADYWGDMLYKVSNTGTVLESHASESTDPSGIVFDGTYLWYCDKGINGPNSTLYKVSLSGAGTPDINIPITSHNYGIVTVGTSETWNMEVENVGDANLEITGLTIPGSAPISSTFNPPQTIAPGNSILIPLKYSPTTVGPLNVTVSVQSTDPITSSVNVTLTGEAVNAGPSMHIPYSSHNYGNVRAGAFTRWFLEIENIGDAILVVSDISSNSDRYIIDESVTFPFNISTLNSRQIGVWFNPLKAGPYVGELTIDNNDPANDPYTINLNGSGLEQQWPIGESLWTYLINTSYDNSPKAICPIQDITGDTVGDVIICSEDNYVRCFNGNSHGIADVMWEFLIYSGNVYDQTGLTTIEDINSDGYEDVIVGTTGGDRSIIAISGKTGTQIWKHNTNEYGNGGWVYAVYANYDYNDDGIMDVLACAGDDGEDTGPLRVYCLNGLDGISIWERPLGGPVFSVIGVEDFTGDGTPDVIAGASNANETSGRVYGINGYTGVAEWTKITAGSSVWALMQLDDITGDGVKDVIAGDFYGNYYYIDPTNNTQLYEGSIGAYKLILRFEKLKDVNADGYVDVLLAHSAQNGIVLNGFDASTIWSVPLADKSWNVASIGDITGDGIDDVIIGTLFSNNYGYFLNGVDGEDIESFNYSTAVDAINSIPDIVGDGTREMVIGGRNGRVYCYSGGIELLVGIDEISDLVNEPLSTNYPNPFSDQTTISFNLDQESFVTLRIYNLNGVVVNTLINNHLPKGKHSAAWNGKNSSGKLLPAGFYIYEISTNKGDLKRKIAKIK